MTNRPFPERADREKAVRTACRTLIDCQVRSLPPDPFAIGKRSGVLGMISMARHAELAGVGMGEYNQIRGDNEALTYALGEMGYLIVYDDSVRSPERIRFSLFHELGHILLGHFRDRNPGSLPQEDSRVLETEANIFARNMLCPPPIVDLIRGNPADPKWAALFCVSESAWRVRQETLEGDRRALSRRDADELLILMTDYVAGRRCRECGAVFADVSRGNVCPRCGSRRLMWNPDMETREQAAARRHAPGAGAEDLRPGIGEGWSRDLTAYWERLRKESAGRKAERGE